MRSLVLSIVAVLVLLPTWSGEERIPLYRGTPHVTVTRVPLDPQAPSRTRLGRLTYLGGLHFKSDDSAFGGFSAMLVEGDRFRLVTDYGLTFAFRMGRDLVPRAAQFGALPDGPGWGWSRMDRDSESIVRDPATGRIWIGFENVHAVWRYDAGLTRAEGGRTPPAMATWPSNGGPEAMVRLRSGRFLILSEDERVRDVGATRVGLIFDRDPVDPRARVSRFTYLPPGGFSPTDAAELPDGRLLVLNRQFSAGEGFTARLVVIDANAVRPGARVSGRLLARFDASIVHDNFEALAVTREGMDTIVWIVSDDNSPRSFQRSLLLKFRLDS